MWLCCSDYLGFVAYGLRGISYFKVTVSGPKQDLHSGVFGTLNDLEAESWSRINWLPDPWSIGGTVHEPLTDLFHLFSKLVSPQGEILVPGLKNVRIVNWKWASHVQFYLFSIIHTFVQLVAPLVPGERERYDAIDFTNVSHLPSSSTWIKYSCLQLQLTTIILCKGWFGSGCRCTSLIKWWQGSSLDGEVRDFRQSLHTLQRVALGLLARLCIWTQTLFSNSFAGCANRVCQSMGSRARFHRLAPRRYIVFKWLHTYILVNRIACLLVPLRSFQHVCTESSASDWFRTWWATRVYLHLRWAIQLLMNYWLTSWLSRPPMKYNL